MIWNLPLLPTIHPPFWTQIFPGRFFEGDPLRQYGGRVFLFFSHLCIFIVILYFYILCLHFVFCISHICIFIFIFYFCIFVFCICTFVFCSMSRFAEVAAAIGEEYCISHICIFVFCIFIFCIFVFCSNSRFAEGDAARQWGRVLGSPTSWYLPQLFSLNSKNRISSLQLSCVCILFNLNHIQDKLEIFLTQIKSDGVEVLSTEKVVNLKQALGWLSLPEELGNDCNIHKMSSIIYL